MNRSTGLAAAAVLCAASAAFAAPSSPADEAAIRAQRTAFNAAIARGDLAAIGSVLADNAQIVTGADSLVYSGRAGELRATAGTVRALADARQCSSDTQLG